MNETNALDALNRNIHPEKAEIRTTRLKLASQVNRLPTYLQLREKLSDDQKESA